MNTSFAFTILQRFPGQNRQPQTQLSQLQLHSSSKVSDATALKREVVAKTMELEKLVREFQQSQSELFSRVHSISDSLLHMSGSAEAGLSSEQEQAANSLATSSFPHAANAANGNSAQIRVQSPMAPGSAASPASQFASLGPLEETLEALKR